MKLDRSHHQDIENSILVNMNQAINLPVLDDSGKPTGVTIYVCTSPFSAPRRQDSGELLKKIARGLTTL